LADDQWLGRADLRLAKRAGFESLVWPTSLWPSGEELQDVVAIAGRCREADLRLLSQIDLTRFPIDHPFVARHLDAFAVRRSGSRAGAVDPRRSLPPTGSAIARLRLKEFQTAFADEFTDRLEGLVTLGVGGFRITPGTQIPADWLGYLIAKVRGRRPDLQFIAGLHGAQRAAAAAFGRAGCDYLVSSFAWWDLGAPWFVEELQELAFGAPVLCEISSEQAEAEPQAINRRLEAAGALGSGVIVPVQLAEGRSAAKAVATAAKVGGSSGEIRRLSDSASSVTVLFRSDGPDLRCAGSGVLVLINRTGEPQPIPNPALLSAAGAAFLDFGSDTDSQTAEELPPWAVRLTRVTRTKSILHEISVHESGPSDKPRLVIEEIDPRVDGGDFAVKRIVGDIVTVEATMFADGHEQLATELCWRAADQREWNRSRMTPLGNDRWSASFPLERIGRHEFAVEGWLDRFGGYQRDLGKKVDAGVAQPVDLAEGRLLVEQAAGRAKGTARKALERQGRKLDKCGEEETVTLLLSDELAELMRSADDRPHRLISRAQIVDAERVEAGFSSWYELFPRSMTADPARHGTFSHVIEHLPRVRAMGFDTLYFPPIHPIGRTNRKGPNNTLIPGPDDPGSPYAIGSQEGGHDAIHPELGSFEDFDRLVKAAAEHGLEIALDFAIQASPDHPWLERHPGWFAWRPDGSMKYAENPPKKYQDIVNVDFYGPDAVPELWQALRDVVLLWVDHGIKAFRVDNPHTKPLPFWEWMIGEVRARHPDVIFLSEAFTRPTMMYRLAKVGFSQSYTYFTWRDRKQELMDYVTELTTTAPKEFYRPHFFVNTPDINPFFLQTSGRPGFRIRAVLAATLSGLWGVYSGFELCESEPLGPGKEEYLDSEKFEIRVRDWDAPGNIVADITLLNRLRRSHPALQTHLNTRFYAAHDDNIIWYGKPSPSGREMIMVMVNLDPHYPHECDFEVPLWEFGLADHASIAVEDLAAGHSFSWHGKIQRIRLTPDEPYRIWRLSLGGDPA
jgi:starch synthase (maltosyl-transferring)